MATRGDVVSSRLKRKDTYTAVQLLRFIAVLAEIVKLVKNHRNRDFTCVKARVVVYENPLVSLSFKRRSLLGSTASPRST